ncbi:melanocortin receptor 4-like isoform X1 [Rhopilema esculentum]|uniref:melanocortin receptor 4-like isoform X1 n=1 Tax=Rhopilema esculentum TaxID=499914 RepID=UPI0031D5AADD
MIEMSSETYSCINTDVLLRRGSDQDSMHVTAFLGVYITFGVVSTILNTLVIGTLLFSKDLHGTFYIILTSLFASDLITGVVIFPMLAIINALSTPRNCALLDSCQYFVHTISLSSIFSMMAIAYDRYLRVAKRHTYNIFMTKTKGFAIVISIWVAAPFLGLISLIVSAKIIAFTAVCVICLILYLYVMMLKKLRSNVNQVPANAPTRPQVKSQDGGVRRSSRLVFILVLVMLMLWCPYIVLSMMSGTVAYLRNVYAFAAIQQLPLLSAMSSPFLYFWTNRTTRRSFVAFCLKVYCRKAEADRIVTVCT